MLVYSCTADAPAANFSNADLPDSIPPTPIIGIFPFELIEPNKRKITLVVN